MTVLQSLVLGIIQGIAEWLPISSQGINNLVLLHFFEKTPSEAIRISIWLHTGTVLAAIVYFRKEISDLLRHFPGYLREWRVSGQQERDATTTFLIISTLLTGVVGAPLLILGLNQETIPAGLFIAR